MLERDGEKFEVSHKKVDRILIATAATLSTDVLKFAIDNKIDVVFLDQTGEPYGRVWSSKLGSTVLIRRHQLDTSRSDEGWTMAREWVIEKLQNQIDFLSELGRRRSDDKASMIQERVDVIENSRRKVEELEGRPDEVRDAVMGFEGTAGRQYFSTLGELLPKRYEFHGRSRNPAGDRFNAFINYGYGILYSKVEAACVIAGLDPYIGFIHADNYNKVSLVFDLIEMFRIFVEEPVFYLFSKRQVSGDHVDEVKGGYRLNEEGRALLIENFNDHMEEGIRYRERNIQRKNVIQFRCHQIANSLIGGEA